MNEDAAVNEDEIDAGGKLEVLNPTGHFEIRWGKKKTEIESAEATFNDLLKKGYLAFAKKWTGRKGKTVTEFDPTSGVLIFDKDKDAAENAAKAEENAVKAKLEAEEKARCEAETAKKQARIDAAKRAKAEASDHLTVARDEHEAVVRKRREVRTQKDAANQGLKEAAARLETAREKALSSAPKPDGSVDLEAVKELEIALDVAKKATALVETTRVADVEVDASESAAYVKKREATKAADAAEREYEDAMTDLHGQPSNEQTKKFDKNAKTTMAPPLRGG